MRIKWSNVSWTLHPFNINIVAVNRLPIWWKIIFMLFFEDEGELRRIQPSFVPIEKCPFRLHVIAPV